MDDDKLELLKKKESLIRIIFKKKGVKAVRQYVYKKFRVSITGNEIRQFLDVKVSDQEAKEIAKEMVGKKFFYKNNF